MIFSGVFSATSSMSMPPSVLAMTTGALRRAVEQDGKVKFARDVHRFGDEHLAHQLAFRPGLVRDQRLPEHFPGDFACLFRCVAEVHAPLETILERALASSTRVDLRFDDDFLPAECCERPPRLPPAW